MMVGQNNSKKYEQEEVVIHQDFHIYNTGLQHWQTQQTTGFIMKNKIPTKAVRSVNSYQITTTSSYDPLQSTVSIQLHRARMPLVRISCVFTASALSLCTIISRLHQILLAQRLDCRTNHLTSDGLKTTLNDEKTCRPTFISYFFHFFLNHCYFLFSEIEHELHHALAYVYVLYCITQNEYVWSIKGHEQKKKKIQRELKKIDFGYVVRAFFMF